MHTAHLGLAIGLALIAQTALGDEPSKAGSGQSAPTSSAVYAKCSGYINGFAAMPAGSSRPTLLDCTSVSYPSEAKAAGHQGFVSIAATVDPTGKTVSPHLAGQGSHAAELDAIAIEAITHWTFSPAKDSNGAPIETTVRATIEFWKDNIDNISQKSCGDYVQDSDWFKREFPEMPRAQMHLYYVVVERLARDAFYAKADQATVEAIGRRLPATLDTTYQHCAASPRATFLTTLQKDLGAS